MWIKCSLRICDLQHQNSYIQAILKQMSLRIRGCSFAGCAQSQSNFWPQDVIGSSGKAVPMQA